MKGEGMSGGGMKQHILISRLIGENLVKRQVVKSGHAPGQINARKLRACLNPRQVARIGAKLTGRLYQAQPHGESFVAKGTHDAEYIAPSAIFKSSKNCVWRETIAEGLADNIPMAPQHHIGWAIVQVMKAKKVYQERLAEVCDVHPSQITRWLKKGQPISSDNIQVMADFLGVKVSELYRIAETGIFQVETDEDQRKARLKAMIDNLDPDQLSILFPEATADPQLQKERQAA